MDWQIVNANELCVDVDDHSHFCVWKSPPVQEWFVAYYYDGELVTACLSHEPIEAVETFWKLLQEENEVTA